MGINCTPLKHLRVQSKVRVNSPHDTQKCRLTEDNVIPASFKPESSAEGRHDMFLEFG